MVKFVIVLSVILSVGSILGEYVPVPVRPLGFVYKNVPPTAHVHIEFFLDLLCPDSQASFPILKEVGDHYGNCVRIAAINFPLPYHRNGYLAAMGVHAVDKMSNGDVGKVYGWMEKVFANVNKFGETVNFYTPENDTVDEYGTIAASLGYSSDTFKQLVTTDVDTHRKTRMEWKYGCTRGVAGTPWFIVNGVTINTGWSWKFQNWKNLIDPLLAKGKEQLSTENCVEGTERCEYSSGKVECCALAGSCIPNVGCRC